MRIRLPGPVIYSISAAVALILLTTAARWSPSPGDQSPDENLNYHPHLLREAARKGIWPGMGVGEPGESNWHFYMRTLESYAITDVINPYFQNGDFDHDGLCDLAIAVIERSSGRHGIAIVPATLDTIYLFNVGPSPIPERDLQITGLDVEYIEGPYVRRIVRDRLIVYRKSGLAVGVEIIDARLLTYIEDDTDGDIPDPPLVLEARKEGLWPEGIRYEIRRDVNPSHLRGDFNGDGEFDIAVLIRDTSNREKGIVIIPSTLDTLYALFTSTLPDGLSGGIKSPGRILLIPKGEVLSPFSDSGSKPSVTLESDAIWAGSPGAPYSGAWYFSEGRLQWMTLSD